MIFNGRRPWLEKIYRERRGGPKLKLDLADGIDRTTFLLALCESDRKHSTEKVGSNITANLESAGAFPPRARKYF
jgi:hypothetical protein